MRVLLKIFHNSFKKRVMVRVFSYNIFPVGVFPYPSGRQYIHGIPVVVVQGIFTCGGKKSLEYVTREDSGYEVLTSELSKDDTVIGFFGKETSGASAALDIFLEDHERIGFCFVPIFCRHVTVLEQSKLVFRKIPYRIFIDYSKQCEEWTHLEDALLGVVARLKRAQ